MPHEFSEKCPRCQAILRGTSREAHTEECRDRMQRALSASQEGRRRAQAQAEKHNARLARKLTMGVESHSAAGVPHRAPSGNPSSSSHTVSNEAGEKRRDRYEQSESVANTVRVVQGELNSEGSSDKVLVFPGSSGGQPAVPIGKGGRGQSSSSGSESSLGVSDGRPVAPPGRASVTSHGRPSDDMETEDLATAASSGQVHPNPGQSVNTQMGVGLIMPYRSLIGCVEERNVCSKRHRMSRVRQPNAATQTTKK